MIRMINFKNHFAKKKEKELSLVFFQYLSWESLPWIVSTKFFISGSHTLNITEHEKPLQSHLVNFFEEDIRQLYIIPIQLSSTH